MSAYSGECIGGPADGEHFTSPVPWFRIAGWIDLSGLAKQADERKGWSDRAPIRDVYYIWEAERGAWVPGDKP